MATIIRYGANTLFRDLTGQTAQDLAADGEQEPIMALIKNARS